MLKKCRQRPGKSWFLALLLLCVPGLEASAPISSMRQKAASAGGSAKKEAESCDSKVKRLQAYIANPIPPGKVGSQATTLTESELNSYFDLVLRPQYHPSLKGIRFQVSESRLRSYALLDFDRLELDSTQILTGLIRKLLSGVHSLTILGGIVSGGGKASFRLDEATFDGVALPNLLVSEIISAVGRKQNPPFDPMQPSALPYGIQRVELHSGRLVVYQ